MTGQNRHSQELPVPVTEPEPAMDMPLFNPEQLGEVGLKESLPTGQQNPNGASSADSGYNGNVAEEATY